MDSSFAPKTLSEMGWLDISSSLDATPFSHHWNPPSLPSSLSGNGVTGDRRYIIGFPTESQKAVDPRGLEGSTKPCTDSELAAKICDSIVARTIVYAAFTATAAHPAQNVISTKLCDRITRLTSSVRLI